MKTIKSFCLLLLVLTGTLPGARGEPFRTDINPALVYYRAFLLQTEPISQADWDYLASKEGKEQKLPERFGKSAARYDPQFELVRQAAHATVLCDWGIDFSPGPNILLPHLARAKAVCQTAQLRAVWALQHGGQEDARDDLLAAFVLGRNVASDGLLISALVQFAIENLEYGTVAQHFGEVSPETLKQLVAGFDAAPARHTMADCVPTEKFGFYDWMVNKILELQKAHPGDDTKVMAGFRDCGVVMALDSVGYTNFWPRLVAASGGTSEGVLKLLREEETLFPRVARIMALPPPEYELQAKQFLADIQNSQNPFFGALNLYFTGLVLGGQTLQVRPREFRIQAQSAMVHAAVEYKLHGESGLKSVMDPFGNGPFGFRRFVFKGVDRGFELKSAYAGADAPFVMIFVEKQGPAFQVIGPDAGKAIDN
jgi:hypothetical protein